MTITPLTPKGLDAAVPQPPPPGTPPPPPDELNKTVIVSIDSCTAVIKINSRYEKSNFGLWDASRKSSRTRNDRVMFVNADPELLYNEVVDVIDIAKGAGVDKIGLMTEQIQRSATVDWRQDRNHDDQEIRNQLFWLVAYALACCQLRRNCRRETT